MTKNSCSSRVLVAVTAALSMSSSLACSCFYAGVFDEYSRQQPIVVRGTVAEHGAQLRNRSGVFATMTVDVSDSVKGCFPHARFQFEGDTGKSCLRYITDNDYPIGSEHLFILASEESFQPLMSCGESSVLIKGDKAEGHLMDVNGYRTYEVDLEELVESLER